MDSACIAAGLRVYEYVLLGWKVVVVSRPRIMEPNGLVVRPLPQGGCMDASRSSVKVFRFGSFEASVHSGELRCEGMRIHLQGQPFLVLVLLLERAGELVTREELRDRVWPENL